MRVYGPHPSNPPIVTYTVTIDGIVFGSGLDRAAAQRLYDDATGYVVMTNQHGHCYAYKGRGSLGCDEQSEEE